MSCNANNHAHDCNCGWGGQWYPNHNNSGEISTGESSKYFNIYKSFTIPNASCPICGAKVFYYQSPHGGRVFFDALGPPWPKHPCTISEINNIITSGISVPETSQPIKYYWEKEAWLPFFANEVIRVSVNLIKISGLLDNRPLDLFVNVKKVKGHKLLYTKECLYFAKQLDLHTYKLSILTCSLAITTKNGFTSIMYAT